MANEYVSWWDGDFDGDRDVDFTDFLALAQNFQGEVAGLSNVPEPSSAALLLMMGLLFLRRRR